MKRFFSILLLVVYLFNLVGYSVYYHYCISLSDKKIVHQIENNRYREDDLTEIKIPLYLPYYSNYNQYERVDGEIVINDIHYNYVKRKIVNDTMYLMCLPNFVKTQLYKEKHNYASQNNDLPANGKENNSAKKNGFTDEYVGQLDNYSFASSIVILQKAHPITSFHLQPGFCTTQCQPPDITG